MPEKLGSVAETLKLVGPRLAMLRPPRTFYLETIFDLQFSKRDFTAKCRAAVQAAMADARFIYASTILNDFADKYPQVKRCAEAWIFRAEFEMAIFRRNAAIDAITEGLKNHAEPMELLAEAYRLVTHGQVFNVKRAPNASIAVDKSYLEILAFLCETNKWSQASTSRRGSESERGAGHIMQRSSSSVAWRATQHSSWDDSRSGEVRIEPRPGQRLISDSRSGRSQRSMTPSSVGRSCGDTARLPIQYGPHEHVNRAEVTNYYTQMAEKKRTMERREELGLSGIRSRSNIVSLASRSSSTSKSPLNVPVINKYQEVVAKSYRQRIGDSIDKRQRLNRDRRRQSDDNCDFFDLTEGVQNPYISELSFELPEARPSVPKASRCTCGYTAAVHSHSQLQNISTTSTKTNASLDIDSHEQMYGRRVDGRPQSASFSSVFSEEGDELPPISKQVQSKRHHEAVITCRPSISAFDLDKKSIPFLSSQVN